MADGSQIEWTDATWNVITGCSVISPGCTNCYAMGLAGSRLANHPSRIGLTKESNAGPVWTGEVRFNEYWLDLPLNWRRPRRVFFCAHGDAFHDDVPVEWLDLCFAVMAASPQHQFQVLTKRSAGMASYFATLSHRGDAILATIKNHWTGWTDRFATDIASRLVNWASAPLPNVWLGVSAEDQKRADERVADLLSIAAAVHWVSHEPALGPIDFRALRPRHESHRYSEFLLDALGGEIVRPDKSPVCSAEGKIDWIVSGGESGPSARPAHPEWIRAIRNDCADAGVAFNFKQWGNWQPVILPEGTSIDLDSIGKGKTPRVNVPAGMTPPVFKAGKTIVLGIDGTENLRSPVALMQRVSKQMSEPVLDGEYHRAMPVDLEVA